MRYLIYIILLIGAALPLFGQTNEIKTELPCQTCHTGGNWQENTGGTFDHNTTSFALLGTHGDLACTQCHGGSTLMEKHDFGRLEAECAFCHEDVHNDEWGSDCEQCHSPETWVLDTQQQNHDLTRFPLQGPHRSLNCESCHVSTSNSGQSLPVDCWGCHAQNYRTSVSPDHETLVLETDCETCHQPESSQWSQSSFDHGQAGWSLIGMHAEADCSTCHTQAANGTPKDCRSCHLSDYNSSGDPAHAEMGFPTNCSQCHTSFNWNSSFIHDRTGFDLRGAHTDLNCFECHAGGQFDDTPESCAGCHTSDYEQTDAPAHNDADFDLDCDDCHTESSWTPTLWLHDIDTEYALTGAHLDVDCVDCHRQAPYSEQPNSCYDCHQTDYEQTFEPNHIEGNIPQTCEVCHTTTDWQTEEIDHSVTEFPLVGAHEVVDCETCHAESYDLEFTCDACHRSNYDKTSRGRGPDHDLFNFPFECEDCHGQFDWSPANFDHDPALTDFEIRGAHLNLLPNDCESCHEEAQWSDIPVDCQNCHQNDFANTETPDHGSVGFPENLCESCHNEEAWDPSIFDHELDINSCATCHLVNYNGADNPVHEEAGFDTECEVCHTSTAWVPGIWDHGSETDFDPQGAHVEIDCNSCHTTSPWEDLSSDCGACHQSNYDETSDPDHEASGFPVNLCESCHSQSVWEPSIFEHESTLEACATCHQVQYNNTTEPPHETLSYALECETCHSTESWSPSTFEHNVENTGFLMDGAHLEVDCSSCHANYQPPVEVRTCGASSCHAEDYQSSTNPPHETMAFSQDCTDCHTTSAWLPSQFQHSLSATGFVLEGAHVSTDCQQCHQPWQIQPNPRTCAASSCHLSDYEGVTNPNHQSGSFPFECETCHSLDAWTPATFDHDGQFFPIYSGKHDDEWNDCSQCHINSNDFAEFTCFGAGCHSISEMNNEHCEGNNCESCNGFTYPSTGVTPNDCYTCHPNGDEDDCDGDGRFRIPRFRPSFLPSYKGPDETD